jgi:hypothetical protein
MGSGSDFPRYPNETDQETGTKKHQIPNINSISSQKPTGMYCNHQLRFLFCDLSKKMPAAISMKIFIVRKINLNYDK